MHKSRMNAAVADLLRFIDSGDGNGVSAPATQADSPQAEAPSPADVAAKAESPDAVARSEGYASDHSKHAVLADLTREREARKAAEARLKEIEDANLSEIEKAQRDAEEYRSKLASLQVENARSRIALEKGVPSDLIEFIVGEDEEQMAAKADLLMSRLNSTPSTPKPDFTQGASGTPAPATRPGADTFAAGVRL